MEINKFLGIHYISTIQLNYSSKLYATINENCWFKDDVHSINLRMVWDLNKFTPLGCGCFTRKHTKGIYIFLIIVQEDKRRLVWDLNKIRPVGMQDVSCRDIPKELTDS